MAELKISKLVVLAEINKSAVHIVILSKEQEEQINSIVFNADKVELFNEEVPIELKYDE